MKDPRGRRGRERGPRINRQIRVPECRLVGGDGTQYGVVSLDEARNIAQDQGLDLVEVSPHAKPPVVKIIDYGKFKYDQQKAAAVQKKKQIVFQLKEIQFRPNIELHDLETKLKRAKKFLEGGDKLKMVMQFRGREMAYKDVGKAKFNAILKQVEDLGAVKEADPKMMGNRIIVIMAPDKKLLQKYKEKKGLKT
ncbi:MAG: translation initiation factor IF-3 [Deltaproteobacteria bacterium]|nr:MAG: translation initiation factor IF-3 [Deltaproteobacteria bacterium]